MEDRIKKLEEEVKHLSLRLVQVEEFMAEIEFACSVDDCDCDCGDACTCDDAEEN